MNQTDQQALTNVAARIDPSPDIVAVVRTKVATKTASGLHLPTEATGKRPPNTGIVLARGEAVPANIQIGSKVTFSIDALHVTTIDGYDVILMPSEMVYAAIL